MTTHENKYELQIIINSGPELPEKAMLGFAAALSAASSGVSVTTVLAMRGAAWAAESMGNEISVPGYPSVGEMIALIMESGGTVRGCSSCVDQYCPAPRGEDGEKVLREGIVRVGLNVVTLRMLETPTVTF